MPKTTTTTVTRNSEGQYQVTIPKALADAMDLADEKVEWDVVSSEKLQMAVKDDWIIGSRTGNAVGTYDLASRSRSQEQRWNVLTGWWSTSRNFGTQTPNDLI